MLTFPRGSAARRQQERRIDRKSGLWATVVTVNCSQVCAGRHRNRRRKQGFNGCFELNLGGFSMWQKSTR